MLDMNNKVLSDYVKRLKKEALLKALLCALSVSFAAVLVAAIVCWFTEFSGYWIFAIAFAVPFGAAMPLFYFFAFYPSERYVAKRLDKLGLKERILTMVEFSEQDSYIAQRQRADAIAALNGVSSRLVKYVLSAALIILPAVAVSTATAMTTVYALSEAEVIASGKDLIGNIGKDNSTFEIVYRIPEAQQDYGVLYSASNPDGATEITFVVGRGGSGEAVLPQAARGYVFVRWSDGVADYIRTDTNVQGKIVVTAIFEEIGLDFGDDKKTDEEGPESAPKKGNQNGDPDDRMPPVDADRKPIPEDDEPQPPGGGVGGGENVFDGQTDYAGEPWADGNQTSQSELGQENGMDDFGKGMAGDYFGGINKG